MVDDGSTHSCGETLVPVSSFESYLQSTNTLTGTSAGNSTHSIATDGSKSTITIHHTPPGPTTDDEDDAKSYPEGGLRAWLVVLGSFSGMTASFGIMNTLGTFQAYLSTHQLASYSPSSIGWIFGLYVFLGFFCGVQIGPIFDAKGPRWIVALGTIFLCAGMLGIAFSTEFWHFIVTFSILCGIGTSLIFTPAIASIAHFFHARRATATGIAATGGSVGGIVFPLMLQALFPRIGFRYTTLLMAIIVFFLLLLANILIRSRLPPRQGGSVLPDFRIFKDMVFTFTTLGVFFVEWGLFVPLSYISSYALHNGVGPTFSYQLLAIVNAGSFFGRWLPGYGADKLGRFNMMILTVLMCLACVLGLWLTANGNIAQLCVFGVGFGFASGSNISLTPVCVGQLCDTEDFGRWYATSYTIVSFGCLTGIPIAGQILDYYGGDYGALIVFTGICYVAALASFVSARVRKVGWDPRTIY
ncbi:MAG: hypothetical protein HETSPECPRED_001344 [Heterodermia speciosa]|uniref:Major facilitator superfamily (MFS) profile domain-containing protein n=1 Tax=Heterodermia speciosa TaxID=116794 RepID=A0A8H3EUY2_9LECA|nr:MAG: hypothetical protein HETSPECPRED_001344 [Heterodermia speciosa]